MNAMDPNAPAPASSRFDPARHDNQIVALFKDAAAAEFAPASVAQAGVGPDRVEVMAEGAALHRGAWHPVQDLFVPEDDYHDFHHALGRGHAMVIVRPMSSHERDEAIWALEGCAPMDIEEHGRHWRGTAAPANRFEINHATVSRADMRRRVVGGQDEVILDMTGQKMTVRTMSEADMAAAPFVPLQIPAERPASPPERETPILGTTYTYGVPADVVQRMTPEEQVMAQPGLGESGERTARGTFLKSVGNQTQVGWRDRHPRAVRVRSYVMERPALDEDAHRS